MKKKIRQIRSLLCLVILLGTSVISTSVSAANTASKDLDAENGTVVFTEDQLSAETIEVLEELMLGDEFQKDSMHILGELDGDTIYAKVTDVTTVNSIASTYSSIPVITMTGKSFTIYKENILGIMTEIFTVRIECHWIIGQKIAAMAGVVQKPKAGVSYKWNDKYKKQTDLIHTLGLDFTYGSKSGTLFFSGILLKDDRSTVSITMGY